MTTMPVNQFSGFSDYYDTYYDEISPPNKSLVALTPLGEDAEEFIDTGIGDPVLKRCRFCPEIYISADNAEGMAEHSRTYAHLSRLHELVSEVNQTPYHYHLQSATNLNIVNASGEVKFGNNMDENPLNEPNTLVHPASIHPRCGLCGITFQRKLSSNPQWDSFSGLPINEGKFICARSGHYCESCEAVMFQSTFTQFQRCLFNGKPTEPEQLEVDFAEFLPAAKKTNTKAKEKHTDAAAKKTNKKSKSKQKNIKCKDAACPRMFKQEHHMQTHFDVTHLRSDTATPPPPASPAVSPLPASSTTVSVKHISCARKPCQKKFKTEAAMQMHYQTRCCLQNQQVKPANAALLSLPKAATPVATAEKTDAAPTAKKSAFLKVNNAEKTLKCKHDSCIATFAKTYAMEQHYRVKHGPKVRKTGKALRAKKTRLHCTKAPICPKTFNCGKAVQQHIKSGKCKGLEAASIPILDVSQGTEDHIKEENTEKPGLATSGEEKVEKTKDDTKSAVSEPSVTSSEVVDQNPEEIVLEEPEEIVLEEPEEPTSEAEPISKAVPPEEPVLRKVRRPSSPTRKLAKREKWVIVGRDEVEVDSEVDEGSATPTSEVEDEFVLVERIMD